MLTCLIQKKFSSPLASYMRLTQCNPSGGNIYPDNILLSVGKAVTQQHPCNWSHSMLLHVMTPALYKVTKSLEARPIRAVAVINFLCLYPFHYVWELGSRLAACGSRQQRQGFAEMQSLERKCVTKLYWLGDVLFIACGWEWPYLCSFIRWESDYSLIFISFCTLLLSSR